MAKVVTVYHSGYGHTKLQAEAVHRGAGLVAGVEATLLSVDEVPQRWDALHQADAIIFGCPTYMGGPSAPFKAFIDSASKFWMEQRWKDKLAAGFTNSGSPSGDKQTTLQILQINAMQHSMIWVSLGQMPNAADPANFEAINRLGGSIGAMAQSPHGQRTPLPGDLKTAELLGQRVAEAAVRWARGKA